MCVRCFSLACSSGGTFRNRQQGWACCLKCRVWIMNHTTAAAQITTMTHHPPPSFMVQHERSLWVGLKWCLTCFGWLLSCLLLGWCCNLSSPSCMLSLRLFQGAPSGAAVEGRSARENQCLKNPFAPIFWGAFLEKNKSVRPWREGVREKINV